VGLTTSHRQVYPISKMTQVEILWRRIQIVCLGHFKNQHTNHVVGVCNGCVKAWPALTRRISGVKQSDVKNGTQFAVCRDIISRTFSGVVNPKLTGGGIGIHTRLAPNKSRRVECLRPLLMGVKHVSRPSNKGIGIAGSSPALSATQVALPWSALNSGCSRPGFLKLMIMKQKMTIMSWLCLVVMLGLGIAFWSYGYWIEVLIVWAIVAFLFLFYDKINS